ncbi:MAG: winged helix-turn-helix transcriptional regulator [Clostridia bacterium]|nr:winged helix-turn-helix transcriptional regulator [Clostridia bacterium]
MRRGKLSTVYSKRVKIFKAFSDESRLRVIELLQSGEKCGCTLEEMLPICQSTLSHHMKILVESGIVEVRKDKKWSYYSISDEGIMVTQEFLGDLLVKHYDTSIINICEEKG